MKRHETESIIYYSYPLFDRHPEVTNVVSTRYGGVSRGSYHSLNLALHVGDESERVLRNRATLCQALGIDRETLTAARQVHGTRIAVITEADRGRGAFAYSNAIPSTDGLVTNVARLPLLVLVADCAALSFYDPAKGVIALAHGSWRGTLGRVAEKIISTMGDAFGSEPEDIIAGISPSIGPCCYEVRRDLIDAFYRAFHDDAEKFFVQHPGETARLNLWAANRQQMLEAGLKEESIEAAGICTACCTDIFYSYRAERGKTGRFGGLIALGI